MVLWTSSILWFVRRNCALRESLDSEESVSGSGKLQTDALGVDVRCLATGSFLIPVVEYLQEKTSIGGGPPNEVPPMAKLAFWIGVSLVPSPRQSFLLYCPPLGCLMLQALSTAIRTMDEHVAYGSCPAVMRSFLTHKI
ncbi:hypothetical protein BHM03_00060629 [Ensete ventricosum]|nr:hypothetical protein BHM03_00060629 [Ensete ventricosum]